MMSQHEPTIFVVDDDASVRDSLEYLFRSVGLRSLKFASAAAFLDAFDPQSPGCLVLDVRMPGMGGLELQEELVARGSSLPIIFVTAHGDVPMAVQAVKDGAVDFLIKPFRDQELLDKVQQAVLQDAQTRERLENRGGIVERMASLTPREREVMELVVDGKANKVIAIDLGISQRTVEIHRARVMEKMHAASVAQLVQLVLRARE
jgi:FixJ family two-component response regulator